MITHPNVVWEPRTALAPFLAVGKPTRDNDSPVSETPMELLIVLGMLTFAGLLSLVV